MDTTLTEIEEIEIESLISTGKKCHIKKILKEYLSINCNEQCGYKAILKNEYEKRCRTKPE
jgi:hypothetical protein